jgi:alpha-mannosidase
MNRAGMDESMARLTSQALEHRTLLVLAASFRVAEAVSLDILEEEVVPRQIEVNDNTVRFSYRPREIITLLLRPSR